jgi:Secretion system C-terminal sorting domain
MKNYLFLSKSKPIGLLMAMLIITFSLAWTYQSPFVQSYITNVSQTSKGTTVTCTSRAQFEIPKAMLQQIYPKIDVDLSKLRGIIFYHNLPKSTINNKDVNHVEGISVYYSDPSNFLHHTAFIKETNTFVKVEELNLKTDKVTFNDINFIQRELSNRKTLSSYQFFSNLLHQPYTVTPADLGLKRAFLTKDPSVVTCPSPCDPLPDQARCVEGDKPGSLLCSNGDCPLVKTENNTEVQATFSKEHRATYLDLQLYREFRDQFLSQCTIGKKYIQYYYAMGDYITKTSKFNGEIMVKSTKLAPQLYKTVRVLLNPNAQNEVVITKSQKNSFVDLLELYKGLSDNRDYQAILTDIENDIAFFEGKTRSSLVNYLGVASPALSQSTIVLYPNPVSEIMTVESPIAAQAHIINNIGQQVQTLQLTEGKNQLSVQELTAGIYWLQYQGGALKFIKQ